MNTAILEKMKQAAQGTLTDHLGFELVAAGTGSVTAAFEVKPHHLAPNGYLHAASIIMLADSCCGFGCMMHLPEGAQSFTTIEIKSNHLGTSLMHGFCFAFDSSITRSTKVIALDLDGSETLRTFR